MSALLLALLAAGDASVALRSVGCPFGMEELVGAELGAAGFTVGAAQGQGLLARIEVSCSDGGMTVRVDDLVTDKRVERRLGLAAGARADSRAAVQVVELLHASLAEARYRSAPVPPPVTRFLTQQEPASLRARVGLAGGALVAPGGFGAQPAVAASFSGFVGPLEAGAAFEATVHPTRFAGAFGYADVGLVEARATAGLELLLGAFALHPRVGLGALVVWAAGAAQPGFTATSGLAPTFAASLGLLAEWRVTSGFSVVALAEATLCPFPVVVRLPEGGATIGQPTLFIGLGGAFR